jgi:hypothetical protein
MQRTDLNYCGGEAGGDISYFLTKRSDACFYADLLRIGVENSGFTSDVTEHFDEFRKKVVSFAASLPEDHDVMLMTILCETKEILHIHNVDWDILRAIIRCHISDHNIDIPTSIDQLIRKTNVLLYGPAAISQDIAHYLTTRAEVLLFAHLVNVGITMDIAALYSKEVPLTADVVQKFTAFHQALLEYAHGLPN